MYYLLEDNRIIKGERLSHWEEVGKDRNFIVFINGEFKSVGKIKAQSENVADFIEVGDLVKFAWNNRNDNCPVSIRKVYSTKKYKDNGWLTVDYELAIYDDEILAIYKPDKHGNYIKVWERGNDYDR